MKIEINQQISQLIDDELEDSEQFGLLEQIRRQPDLMDTISRYQAVSHVLRTDDFILANENFTDRVSQQIAKEPHHLIPKAAIKNNHTGFWKKTSMAVAASLAIFAVLLSQRFDLQKNSSQPLVALATAELQPVKKVEKTEAETQSAEQRASIQHERLKAYLRAHSDDIYTHGSLNMHPYANVATFSQE